jgi:hypothetical protein
VARERIASASRNVVTGYEGSWAECVMTNFLDQPTCASSVVDGTWEIFAPRDGPARRTACTIGSGLVRSPSNRIGLLEELLGKIA